MYLKRVYQNRMSIEYIQNKVYRREHKIELDENKCAVCNISQNFFVCTLLLLINNKKYKYKQASTLYQAHKKNRYHHHLHLSCTGQACMIEMQQFNCEYLASTQVRRLRPVVGMDCYWHLLSTCTEDHDLRCFRQKFQLGMK